jgi:hypothetical protein
MSIFNLLISVCVGYAFCKTIWAFKMMSRLRHLVFVYCKYQSTLIKRIDFPGEEMTSLEDFIKKHSEQIVSNLQKIDLKFMFLKTLKIPSPFLTFLAAIFINDARQFLNFECIDEMMKELSKKKREKKQAK